LTHQHHDRHCHHCLRSKTYAISPFARHIAAINVIVIICGYAPIGVECRQEVGSEGSEGSHFTLYPILKFFIFLLGAAIRMPFLGVVQYKTTTFTIRRPALNVFWHADRRESSSTRLSAARSAQICLLRHAAWGWRGWSRNVATARTKQANQNIGSTIPQLTSPNMRRLARVMPRKSREQGSS